MFYAGSAIRFGLGFKAHFRQNPGSWLLGRDRGHLDRYLQSRLHFNQLTSHPSLLSLHSLFFRGLASASQPTLKPHRFSANSCKIASQHCIISLCGAAEKHSQAHYEYRAKKSVYDSAIELTASSKQQPTSRLRNKVCLCHPWSPGVHRGHATPLHAVRGHQ